MVEGRHHLITTARWRRKTGFPPEPLFEVEGLLVPAVWWLSSGVTLGYHWQQSSQEVINLLQLTSTTTIRMSLLVLSNDESLGSLLHLLITLLQRRRWTNYYQGRWLCCPWMECKHLPSTRFPLTQCWGPGGGALLLFVLTRCRWNSQHGLH